jgi:acylphosphatase
MNDNHSSFEKMFRLSGVKRASSASPMVAKRIVFAGKVQGVGFRYATKEIARSYDVCGWVKNMPDGTVELQIMAETSSELEAFLNELTEESSVAHHIQSMHAQVIPPLEGVKGFSIER